MSELQIGESIVVAGRSWLGTPYRHHQRAKGYGVDCVGFLAGVAIEVGFSIDLENYHALPTGDDLIRALDRHLQRVERSPEPSDILCFRLSLGGLPRHVGIATDIGLIHADERSGRVVETELGYWLRLLAGVWTWPM